MPSLSKTAALALFAFSMFGCAAEGDALDVGQETTSLSQIAQTSALSLPVTVRGTGKATLSGTIYTNPKATGTATLLSVHGLSGTSKVWAPINEALFADAKLGGPVKQIFALDLPGHGDSTIPTGLPAGVKFGDLTIEDNADIIVQAIRALAAQGNGPTLVVGHGAGALAIAAAQEKLLAEGTNLGALGVRRVLFYAPLPPTGRPWTQPATAAASNLAQYLKSDDTLGTTYALPADAWARQGFTLPNGELVAGAPTAAQVTALGYSAIEPVSTLLQITEAPNPTTGAVIKRPTVRAGAFAAANGTNAVIVSFSQNVSVPAADVKDLYQYLTGDATFASYVALDTPDAVSNAFITNPVAVVQSTAKFF